jgi:ubiquinone/menaquinone biosynthesis C-methylase UbiE
MFDTKYSDISDVFRYHWNNCAVEFDNHAAHVLHSDEQNNAWHSLLAALVGEEPKDVLDVGCGTGFLALLFAEMGHRVTGIDLSPKMVELAGAKAKNAALDVRFQVENAMSLSAPDASFDLVIARNVIWTLPDPVKGVREWMRVLRPAGRLALIECKFADSREAARAYARPARRVVDKLVDIGLSFATRCTGRGLWRLYQRKYARYEAQLPFSGGLQPEELARFLREQGLNGVTVQPLDHRALWSEPPKFPRYLATATR